MVSNAVISAIKNAETTLNKNLRNQNADTFLLSLLGENFPVNFTMTKAPLFDQTANLVEMHIDGYTYDKKQKSIHIPERNQVWPKRF
jgi:hypothetical protein